MAHPLAGVDLKLAEADKRLYLLDQEAIRLLKFDGDPLVGEVDPATGDYVLRVASELPPLEIGLEVGLFAHFLRTALDNMLWQLVLARGGTPTDQHQFPIYEERAKFDTDSHRTTRARWETLGISPRDFAFIKRHQPYHLGKNRAKWHPLAMLAHLNNVDKHRYVHPRFAAMTAVVMDTRLRMPRSYFWARLVDEDRRGVMPIIDVALPVDAFSIDVTGSDDDPTEVARLSGNLGSNPHVNVKPGTTLDISFSDRLRPISSEDLYDIRAEVQEIIDRFRPVIG